MAKIYIPVGSVTGTAIAVAEAVGLQLEQEGHIVKVDEAASVDAVAAFAADAIVVCTSTTGSGDLPGNLLPFYNELEEKALVFDAMPFGVISLGDSSYDFTFCGAGELVEERLAAIKAIQTVPRVTIDAIETVTPDEDALFWLKEWSEKTFA